MKPALLGLASVLSLLAVACAPERAAAPMPACPEPAAVPLAPAPAPVEAAPSVAVPGCPPAAADATPVRFEGGEMVALCRDLAVDPAIDPATRRRLADDYAEARAQVARHLGALAAREALVLVCASEACRDHFAGTAQRSALIVPNQRLAGARFRAPRHAIVLLGADERARGTLAHEITHLEIRERIGQGQVPAWFDEGHADRSPRPG